VAPLATTPRASAPAVPSSLSEGDALAERMQKKEAKIRAEAARPLDPWERYRALTDTIEEAFTLTELADRKVRFALLVMAGLNVGVFVVLTRPDLSGLGLHGWVGPWAAAYGVVTVAFLLQAVEALRPREAPARDAPRAASPLERLRDVAAVAEAEPAEYERAWRELRFDQLTAGLAAQAHSLARCNRDKFAALRRLYAGLRLMALLVALLVAVAALAAVFPSLRG
jgi:hypothetical protein